MSLKLHRNDTVEVISGADRGKRGRVLRIIADKNRVLVEHVRTVKKNVKPNPQRNIKGGIAEQEMPIDISNVKLVCATCGPTKAGYHVENGSKTRVCRKCGSEIEAKKK
jgi:large subunit ribosomal protein L24